MSLHIDFETRSATDLKKVGLDNYARDPSTDVWCMGFAFDDEPVDLLTMPELYNRRMALTHPVARHIAEGGEVVAHNAAFELAIWNNKLRRFGWPELKIEQTRCTMAMTYAMALPGSLEKAAAAVGIKEQKNMAGHRLMMQMEIGRASCRERV